MSKTLKFKSFKYNFNIPNNNQINIDESKINNNILLHCAYVGIHNYYLLKNHLPELNNINEINEVMDISYKYYLEIKKNI